MVKRWKVIKSLRSFYSTRIRLLYQRRWSQVQSPKTGLRFQVSPAVFVSAVVFKVDWIWRMWKCKSVKEAISDRGERRDVCALGESGLKLCTQSSSPCFSFTRSEACVTKPRACKRLDFIAFVTLGALSLSLIVCRGLWFSISEVAFFSWNYVYNQY